MSSNIFNFTFIIRASDTLSHNQFRLKLTEKFEKHNDIWNFLVVERWLMTVFSFDYGVESLQNYSLLLLGGKSIMKKHRLHNLSLDDFFHFSFLVSVMYNRSYLQWNIASRTHKGNKWQIKTNGGFSMIMRIFALEICVFISNFNKTQSYYFQQLIYGGNFHCIHMVYKKLTNENNGCIFCSHRILVPFLCMNVHLCEGRAENNICSSNIVFYFGLSEKEKNWHTTHTQHVCRWCFVCQYDDILTRFSINMEICDESISMIHGDRPFHHEQHSHTHQSHNVDILWSFALNAYKSTTQPKIWRLKFALHAKEKRLSTQID